MSNKIKDKQVPSNAFHFEKSAKAKTLHNSSGSKQGRLHLLGHSGLKGMDHHAVAAKVMKFKDGEAPKLGRWDKKYNVLVELPSEDGLTKTWYKINKQSFIKRFNPSEDLKIDKETGTCSNLADLVAEKSESLSKLEAISNAMTPFEKEFLYQLDQCLKDNPYKRINFYSSDGSLRSYDLEKDEADDVLHIYYLKKGIYFPVMDNISINAGKSVLVDVDGAEYKKILSGKPIPQPIIDLIRKKTSDR